MSLIALGTLFVAVIVAGVFFVWKALQREAPTVEAPATERPAVEEKAAFASSTLGFSISYPKNYSVNDAYVYQFGPTKVIRGVKFTISGETTTGTNLSPDTGISVEWLPRAQNCTGDIFMRADVTASKMSEATTYSVATSSSAAAGNLYEEMVYALFPSSPCIALRYFIHSTNIENYEPGSVRPFDRAMLLREFDAIRRSLRLRR